MQSGGVNSSHCSTRIAFDVCNLIRPDLAGRHVWTSGLRSCEPGVIRLAVINLLRACRLRGAV